MYTIQDIENNPNILIFEPDLPMDLKKIAIMKKPSLLEMTDKSEELLKVAFASGYWSDDIKENLSKMDENDICGFFTKADEMFLDKYLELRTTNLSEKETIALVNRNVSYYSLPILTKSDELDWSIIKSIEYMDIESQNPLTYAFNLTSEKVEYLYQKFGKFALMGIPMEYQTLDMKKEIISKNSYDYPFIIFDKDIAQIYVSDYFGSLPYLMQKSKFDPYYDTRILMILSVYGAALQHLENQTEEAQIIAIKNNPMSIEYAIKPSELVCMTAVQLDKDAAELIVDKPKSVCKFLGIDYVKPSKYSAKSKYLITMSQDGQNCFRVVDGVNVDEYLNMSTDDGEKVKKISKVKEISDDEIKVLKKFGIFKTENPFFEEDEE